LAGELALGLEDGLGLAAGDPVPAFLRRRTGEQLESTDLVAGHGRSGEGVVLVATEQVPEKHR
jgi:hypothetical protein